MAKYYSKQNVKFLKNSALLLVAAVLALGVATFMTNPDTNLSNRSKAAEALGNLGINAECDDVYCWGTAMMMANKLRDYSYPWMLDKNNNRLGWANLQYMMKGGIYSCIYSQNGELGNNWISGLNSGSKLRLNSSMMNIIKSCFENPSVSKNSGAQPNYDKNTLWSLIKNKIDSSTLTDKTLQSGCVKSMLGETAAGNIQTLYTSYGLAAVSYIDLNTMMRIRGCFGVE